MFCRNFFFSTRIFRWGLFQYQNTSGIEKFYRWEGVVTRSSVENFCLTVPENFSETLQCFKKIPLSKHFFIVKTGGVGGREYHVLQTKVFCLAAPTNIVVETLCVSKTFGYRKSLWIRGGGANLVLFSKYFVSHCPNLSQGIQSRKLRVSKNFTHEKGISLFSLVYVLSDSAEIFCRELFCVSENFKYRKFYAWERGCIMVFRWKFIVSQCRKVSWRKPSVFQKNSGKVFMHKRGLSLFPVDFVSLRVLKIFLG